MYRVIEPEVAGYLGIKSKLDNSTYPPIVYWAKIIGKPDDTDFFLGTDYRLNISEKAFHVLKRLKIDNAIIEENNLL